VVGYTSLIDIDNLSFLNGFSKFFQWQTLWKICDKIIVKDPTTSKTREI